MANNVGVSTNMDKRFLEHDVSMGHTLIVLKVQRCFVMLDFFIITNFVLRLESNQILATNIILN